MTARGDSLLYAPIDAKLRALVDTLATKPSWYGRWRGLNPDSPEAERLAVYQAIRDSVILPAEAGFYLVSWQIDALASEQAESALRHLDEQLAAIEQEHGLGEDEVWEPDEAPPEYEEVLGQYFDAWDALFAAQLAAHGEHEMAALFQNDRAEYERRSEAGRQYFHGSRLAGADDDDWLDALLDVVVANVEPESPMGPLGLRYREEEGFWEIDVYPTAVELIGGADDSAVVSANFSLDLEGLRSTFERIDDAGWNAFGWSDGDGPFVWIEGSFLGRDVWLRVLAQAPEGEEPGAKLRITREERD